MHEPMHTTYLGGPPDTSHASGSFHGNYLLDTSTSLFVMLVCTRGICEVANMHVGNQGFPTREACRKPKGRESRGRDPIQEGDGWGALISIFGDLGK
jgi:hypothetical protein